VKRVFVYKRFERFWHWAQTILVVLLALTGFQVRFPRWGLWEFEEAVEVHSGLAIAFLVLSAFAVFWYFTTGEWKRPARFSPLQRWVYRGLNLILIPALVISGILYASRPPWVDLKTVAFVHVAAAYVMVSFLIGHVYLATTGRTPWSNIKAMITGWEDVEEE
jgi:thiosulfate reductase cytochrome b subunit